MSSAEYNRMQMTHYQWAAGISIVKPGSMVKDHIVGVFDEHNAWPDYQTHLFRHSKLPADTTGLVALDFACGPGRNIVLFKDRFKRVDGVDISDNNLENAKVYTSCLPEEKRPTLHHCNGLDLSAIPDASYDVVFSTIAMQHICCHSIRAGYMKEFLRVLKPGGFVCVQMGYGNDYRPWMNSIPYHEDRFDAPGTNGRMDTRIEDPRHVELDLLRAGFRDFEYSIRPAGPGDRAHNNWIFWSAQKPN